MEVHTAIVPDIRRKLKDGTYPIKLRVTYNRKRRYFSFSHERTKGINFYVTPDEWERIKGDSPRGRYRDIKLLIPRLIKDADELIKLINPFSFDAFELKWNGTSKAKDLYGMFEAYISELIQEGRIATASSYQCALNSLKEFRAKADFWDVTPDFLEKYENWMLSNGSSISTVGIYTRSLRCIFNQAIKNKLTAYYPFVEYKPPTGENKKKALDITDIGKILNYQAKEGSPEEKAKDIWVFSYFSNGMNIKDICNLQVKDIDLSDMVIHYVRQKTKRTSRTEKKIEVDIVPETLEILKKWGNLEGEKSDFVFPFFFQGITPEQQRAVTQNLVKFVNKYVNNICREVGIPFTVNSYHARHSFANVLKQSGAPIEFISESLGHSDLKTTDSYLKSFTKEYRGIWKNKLSPSV